MIRAEVFGQMIAPNRSTEHPAQRHSINHAAVDAKTNEATRALVHDDENPMCSQRCGFASKQIADPQTVFRAAEKREPGWTSGIRFRPAMNAQDTANNVVVDLDAAIREFVDVRLKDLDQRLMPVAPGAPLVDRIRKIKPVIILGGYAGIPRRSIITCLIRVLISWMSHLMPLAMAGWALRINWRTASSSKCKGC